MVTAEEVLAGNGAAVLEHIRYMILSRLEWSEKAMVALCSKALLQAHREDGLELSKSLRVIADESDSSSNEDPFGLFNASADIQCITSPSMLKFAIGSLGLPLDTRLTACLIANGMLDEAKVAVEELQCPLPAAEAEPPLGSSIAQAAARCNVDLLCWVFHDIAQDEDLQQWTALIAGFTGCRMPGCADTLLPFWEPVRAHRISVARKASMCAIASHSGNVQALEWLWQHGHLVLSVEAAKNAAVEGQTEVLKWLHEHKCPMSAAVVALAAHSGVYDALKYLLNAGVDVDARALATARQSPCERIRHEFGFE